MCFDFPKTALIAVDVQNDFCPTYRGKSGKEHPTGALAVERGDSVVAPLNALASFFAANGGRVIASQDWHPEGHISFAASHAGRKPGEVIRLPVSGGGEIEQVLWPVHCVKETDGAAFHEDFDASRLDFLVRKGGRADLDSYSAFFENDRHTPTELHAALKSFSVDTIVLGGLATDYCVFYSAMDGRRLGYSTVLVTDAVAGVGFPAGSVEKALTAMKEAGVFFATSREILETGA